MSQNVFADIGAPDAPDHALTNESTNVTRARQPSMTRTGWIGGKVQAWTRPSGGNLSESGPSSAPQIGRSSRTTCTCPRSKADTASMRIPSHLVCTVLGSGRCTQHKNLHKSFCPPCRRNRLTSAIWCKCEDAMRCNPTGKKNGKT